MTRQVTTVTTQSQTTTSAGPARRRTLALAAAVLAMLSVGGPAGAALSVQAGAAAPVLTAADLTTTVTSAPMAARSRSASDFASIFHGDNQNLANSGWTACPTPITWSVDTRELTSSQAALEIKHIDWALSYWGEVSGLTFAFNGEIPVNYSDTNFQLTPVDGSPVASRHIYMTFLGIGESKLLSSSILGFGAPSTVVVASKEITGGNAVFRTDHVQSTGRTAPRKVKSLYLHELGHVLGLSHAAETSNIMYPVVDAKVTLGDGDVNGVRTMTKPCPAPAA